MVNFKYLGDQKVLQLMMTMLEESELAQSHVALICPTRQQVLQLMMTMLNTLIISFYGSNYFLLTLRKKTPR